MEVLFLLARTSGAKIYEKDNMFVFIQQEQGFYPTKNKVFVPPKNVLMVFDVVGALRKSLFLISDNHHMANFKTDLVGNVETPFKTRMLELESRSCVSTNIAIISKLSY